VTAPDVVGSATFADLNSVGRPARAEAAARSEREITHLALDAAGDGAPATGADALVAQFLEDDPPRVLPAREGLRGEWPLHAGASGASRAARV
jgi:hypothetical protein